MCFKQERNSAVVVLVSETSIAARNTVLILLHQMPAGRGMLLRHQTELLIPPFPTTCWQRLYFLQSPRHVLLFFMKAGKYLMELPLLLWRYNSSNLTRTTSGWRRHSRYMLRFSGKKIPLKHKPRTTLQLKVGELHIGAHNCSGALIGPFLIFQLDVLKKDARLSLQLITVIMATL